MAIIKLINKRIIKEIGWIISGGKEAMVLSAEGYDRELAVKVYRVTVTFFKDMAPYIEGDKRFSKVKKRRKLINMWASKEYRNLKRLSKAGVRVPEPIALEQNVLVMAFIGKNGNPAPLLKDVVLDNPEEILRDILENIRRGVLNGRIVHGDLSEYNIMIHNGKPYFIDVGQAVLLDHPRAREFLERDIKNVLNYFKRKYGIIKPTFEEVYNYIIGRGSLE